MKVKVLPNRRPGSQIGRAITPPLNYNLANDSNTLKTGGKAKSKGGKAK